MEISKEFNWKRGLKVNLKDDLWPYLNFMAVRRMGMEMMYRIEKESNFDNLSLFYSRWMGDLCVQMIYDDRAGYGYNIISMHLHSGVILSSVDDMKAFLLT